MTKMVKFNKSMSPHVKGEERAVPDDVAERLVKDGDASIVPSIFDEQAVGAPRSKGYLTRKAAQK